MRLSFVAEQSGLVPDPGCEQWHLCGTEILVSFSGSLWHSSTSIRAEPGNVPALAMCGQLTNEAGSSSGTGRPVSLAMKAGYCNSDFFSPESYSSRHM